jgi:hypothetical protein
MAIRYRFPCPHCGNLNSISATMAGQELNCSICDTSFEVPQLKVLKGYEPAESTPTIKPNQLSNRPRILFVLGLSICLLGTACGYALLRYSKSMIVDFSNGTRDIEQMADDLKPGGVLREWYFVERNPDLPEWQEHPAIRYSNQGKILTKFAFGLLAIGGLGLLLLGFGLLDGRRSS